MATCQNFFGVFNQTDLFVYETGEREKDYGTTLNTCTAPFVGEWKHTLLSKNLIGAGNGKV